MVHSVTVNVHGCSLKLRLGIMERVYALYRYCSSKRVPEADWHLRQVAAEHMPHWQEWAQSQRLAHLERRICGGPDTAIVQLADRATVNRLDLACRDVQKSPGGRTYVVMVQTKMEAGGQVLRVGQLQNMFEWCPPWDLTGDGSEALKLQVGNVQWHQPKGVNSELMDCPQVSQEYFYNPVGNLIEMQDVVRVHAALVPHLQEKAWWQVLFRDLP